MRHKVALWITTCSGVNPEEQNLHISIRLAFLQLLKRFFGGKKRREMAALTLILVRVAQSL